MTVQREILYPLFIECCIFTDEPFWHNIFKDMAYGKTPYGTYFNQDFFCGSFKKKKFIYKIDKSDPAKTYEEIRTLLTQKLGLMSKGDKGRKTEDYQKILEMIKEDRESWKGVRNKKSIRDILIEKYILKKKAEHSLTFKQSKILLTLISLAIAFKVITNDDIHYDGSEITSIDCITFKDSKVIVTRNVYKIDSSISPEINLTSQTMADNWEKFLKVLRKSGSRLEY